ncbi:MAG: alpha/beta hydrolase, partial [candidate division Zixibacteria bacterium]|nr:alpha/beta hydrolase [candidate division Zixibacteria bacterium]
MNYLIEGNGIPCFVIGSAIYYPRTFSQDLRKHFKFIFLDIRGFAVSDKPYDLEDITLDTILDDIEQIRQTLNIPKICVLGHSIVGLIALEYARKYPQHVSHVIVIGTPPNGMRANLKAARRHWKDNASDDRKELMNSINEKQDIQKLSKLSPGDIFINTYITNGPLYWYDPSYDCSLLWKDIKIDAKIVGKIEGIFFKNYDIAQGSDTITMPVFIAIGKYDFMVPHYQWDSEIEKLPGLSYFLFEK